MQVDIVRSVLWFLKNLSSHSYSIKFHCWPNTYHELWAYATATIESITRTIVQLKSK